MTILLGTLSENQASIVGEEAIANKDRGEARHVEDDVVKAPNYSC